MVCYLPNIPKKDQAFFMSAKKIMLKKIIVLLEEICYLHNSNRLQRNMMKIMKKLALYIETSLFGFYYDDTIANKEKQESVRRLFKQIADGYFRSGFVSKVTIAELGRSPGKIKDRLLSLINKYQLKEIETDDTKVEELLRYYVKEMPIFKRWENDARHIAIATVSDVDILVTLNCEHIANEQTILKVKEINKRLGYIKDLDIRRPEEVVFYED